MIGSKFVNIFGEINLQMIYLELVQKKVFK